MAYITIELNETLMNGHNVTFKAPCDCIVIEGLKVRYIDNESTLQENIFTMKDAHGNTLTGLENLFKEGAYVHAILDTDNLFAYLQNADTNGYIEPKLNELNSKNTVTSKDIEKISILLTEDGVGPYVRFYMNGVNMGYLRLTR